MKRRLKLALTTKLINTEVIDAYGYINSEKGMLYSKTGKEILKGDKFYVLFTMDSTLFLIKDKAICHKNQMVHEVVCADMPQGKIVNTFYLKKDYFTTTDKIVVYNYPIERYDIPIIDDKPFFVLKEDDYYHIYSSQGKIISESATEYIVDGEVLLFQTQMGVYVFSKHLEEVFDFVKVVNKENEPFYVLGNLAGDEVVYTAMSKSGYASNKTFFKTYLEQSDGILVEDCTKNGEELGTYSYIYGEFATSHKFNMVTSDFSYGRVFLRDKDYSQEDPDRKVYLADYKNNIIAEYKDALNVFHKVKYGEFERIFAIVKKFDDTNVYIDVDGKEFPMEGRKKYGLNASSAFPAFRSFINPMSY